MLIDFDAAFIIAFGATLGACGALVTFVVLLGLATGTSRGMGR